MDYRSACSTAALALLLAGCGETLYEESTGYIDLVQYLPPVARNAADPSAGLTRSIAPTRGWINGSRVEYYDFGSVTVPRKVGSRGEALRVPDSAPIAPMYFFYDQLSRPLFSKPTFDARSNTWFMPGGKNAVDPAPIDSPADPDVYYKVPYVGRPRALYVDDQRGSANYQRPIIDTLMDDSNYNGLWEVVEITVRDSEYESDDVKSAAKVKEGIDDGKLVERRTGFVINCPVVDERTNVLPSAMHGNVPRPRLEIWYRTKLGNCFLANGWESLGETSAGADSRDRDNLRLFTAGEVPASRVNTFEVIAEKVGTETRLSVPVNKVFNPITPIPRNTADGAMARTPYANETLGTALPRRSAADPGGYSPIAWVWNINVPQGPAFIAGTYRDIADIAPPPDPFPAANPTQGGFVEAESGGTTVVTRNIAVIGAATKCTADTECKFGQTCNVMPDTNLATLDPPAGLNIADMVIRAEGGPRCDVPATGFGGYCSPGVSRCDVSTAAGSDNEDKLKALGVASAGPTFTVHAELATARENLDDKTAIANSTDPLVTETDKIAAAMQLPALQAAFDKANERASYYIAQGFTKDLNGWGYLCYPGFTGNGLGTGFCAIRCDSTASGTPTDAKSKLNVNGEKVDYTFRHEPRCGGANMLGYRCLPTGTVPERQRVCVRECNRQANTNNFYVEDPAPTVAFNSALCDHPLNIKPDEMAGTMSTAFALSADLPPMTAVLGQECIASSLSVADANATPVRACAWNPDMAPRNPSLWPGKP